MAGIFSWTKEADKYFSDLGKSSDYGKYGQGKKDAGTKFDAYFLCLTVGFSKAKILDGDLGEEVTRYPPRPFRASDVFSQLFAGLISAELERKGIRFEGNRDKVKDLMVKMIDLEDRYQLSGYAYDLMNKYSNKGFELISKTITKPKDLDTFLSNIHKHFIKE